MNRSRFGAAANSTDAGLYPFIAAKTEENLASKVSLGVAHISTNVADHDGK